MIPFKINIEGKVAVVTGGGGVICGEFSKALAECGAKVAILDLREDAAEAVAESIREKGGIAQGFEANVLSMESLKNARDEIGKKYGLCDILVNGAGGNHPRGTTTKEYFETGDREEESVKSFFDLDPESIRFVFDLNFMGTLLPVQVFAQDMLERENPVIVNVSSMNAFTPLTKIPAYSGAKAAVSNFTQWLAVHFSKTPVRVNAIAPGFFLTDQNRTLLKTEDGEFTERAEKILKSTPMNRFGGPEELVGTLLWLIDSKSSGFVNGVVIPVDGGFSAYSGV